MPHLGLGITFDWEGRRVLASPNLKRYGRVIDTGHLEDGEDDRHAGAGFFMRSHEATRHAWVDLMMSPTVATR